MDLIDHIRALAARIERTKGSVLTEEATKNAYILPFIQALGYDVFDPHEVMPEMVADVGTKKGEKVDYAILLDSKPVMLFECKQANANLDDEHASQLYRYFSVTSTRIAVLTNGDEYRMYSDLESPNKMDSKPFLVFKITDFPESLLPELKRFTKSAFDIDSLLNIAGGLKYLRELKLILQEEFQKPSDEFVRFLASRVRTGRMSTNVKEQFAALCRKACNDFVNERIGEKLKSAMQDTVELPEGLLEPVEDENGASGVITTEEELDAFKVIKAILCLIVDPARITMRDRKSYCSILLDNNNRKPICRYRFGSTKKTVWYATPENTENKLVIQSLDEIYQLSEDLRRITQGYLDRKS